MSEISDGHDTGYYRHRGHSDHIGITAEERATIEQRMEMISESISLHAVSKKAAKAVLLNLIQQAVDEARKEATVCCWDKTSPCNIHKGNVQNEYTKGFSDARERAAKIFEFLKYPECCVQMSYREANECIRAMKPEDK